MREYCCHGLFVDVQLILVPFSPYLEHSSSRDETGPAVNRNQFSYPVGNGDRAL